MDYVAVHVRIGEVLQVSVEVRIPSTFVSTNWGTPTVCARHGEPTAESKQMQFSSPPPGWTYALLLLGVLPFVIAVVVLRKTVGAPAWPFCAHCVQGRKKRLTIGLGTVAAGVVSFALALVMPNDQVTAAGVLLLLGIVLVLTGYIIAMRGANRTLIAGGRVTQDGQLVEFRKAHEAFAAQAAAADQSAAQHYAPR